MISRPFDRHQIRSFINKIFRAAAELDAFMIDYFPDVYMNIGSSADRTTKINMLLETVDESIISSVLRNHYQDHIPSSSSDNTPIPRDIGRHLEISQLRKQLDNLCRLRSAKAKEGVPTGELGRLDADILALRRQIRQGPRLAERDILGERFSLMQQIGKGGAASVWQAYDLQDHRTVAIKVLHSMLSDDPVMLERFIRGARRMKELSHRNIVPIIETVSEDDSWYYFVMEYMAGGNLYDALQSGRISSHDAFKALISVSRALEHAHNAGLVHRDIKPHNILLNEFGEGFLCDFDLVIGNNDTMITQFGIPRGTYGFAAPELLHGATDIDGHSDIFGLAMTGLFIITKYKSDQFFASKAQKLLQDSDPADELWKLLKSATSPDSSARPDSAVAFCMSMAVQYRQYRRKIESALLTCLLERTEQLRILGVARSQFLNTLSTRQYGLRQKEDHAELMAAIHDITHELPDIADRIIRARHKREQWVEAKEGIHNSGDLVMHEDFGVGKIERIQSVGRHSVLTIKFESGGTKTMLSYLVKSLM